MVRELAGAQGGGRPKLRDGLAGAAPDDGLDRRGPHAPAAADHCRNGLPVTESSSPIRDYQSASDFLFGRINYERTRGVPYRSRVFKLHRMQQLAARLGHPEQAFPAIHIAGTKGKGSTAAMVASVLQAGGFRIGLYTSPHLHRLEERFVVDGRPCDAQTLVDLLEPSSSDDSGVGRAGPPG